MNRLLITAILTIVLIALAGTAYAVPLPPLNPMPGLTVTADTVQTNGHYIGVPKLLNGETSMYGYEYTLVPDGTYTVMGTVKNDRNADVGVFITLFNITPLKAGSFASDIVPPMATLTVPAKSQVDYSILLNIPGYVSSPHDIGGIYIAAEDFDFGLTEINAYQGWVDFSQASYVDAPQSSHTVDLGPMSDAVAVFDHGKMSYTGKPQYTIGLE